MNGHSLEPSSIAVFLRSKYQQIVTGSTASLRLQCQDDWLAHAVLAACTFDGSATLQYIGGQRSTTSTGNPFADLLLGYPQTGTTAVGTSVGWFHESQVAAYIQDDWKITPRVTLNLGLRYDFDNPPIDKNGGALYSIALNEPFLVHGIPTITTMVSG